MASIRLPRLTGLRGGVIGGGQQPAGRGFIGGGNQHTNTLQLQLRLLPSGIICRHGCPQAVTAQHADDQFRLDAAGNIDPVHPERFYKAYRRIKVVAFYLSPDQIDEVNALRDDHWERRMAEGASIWANEAPLHRDPEMTDKYPID